MSNSKDPLGDRIKKNYEHVNSQRLTRRTPVIIRLDGCHFHTLTKGFDKPFDSVLKNAMDKTMLELCKSIQGCVMGYSQSDEITLVLVDYTNIDSSAWFDYKLQKVCSVSASMATGFFYKAFYDETNKFIERNNLNINQSIDDKTKRFRLYIAYQKAIESGAVFDSRAFNVPKEEVCNCLIWRQQDAEKNSVQMLARTLYKHKELQGISKNKLQDKMFTEHGVNWNEVETRFKRGSACIKDSDGKWFIDNEMPILKSNQDYVNRLVFI